MSKISIPRPHILSSGMSTILRGVPNTKLKDLERDLMTLKEELAEYILLESQPIAVSTYGMTYEQQCELPYYARL